MSPEEQTTKGSSGRPSRKTDAIFKLFAEPGRRKLLLALARQGAQPPSLLKDKAGLTLDGTIKRLASLRSKGLVVMKGDKVDKRRQLFSLSPTVPLITTRDGTAFDFECLQVPVTGPTDLQPAIAGVRGLQWEPDTVFFLLGHPARRKLLAALALQPQSAEELTGRPGYEVSRILKQLKVLCLAGFLVAQRDRVDGCRYEYSIAPNLPLRKTENGPAITFHFCTVHL